MACLYAISCCLSCDSADRRLPRNLPASKIGAVTCAPYDHVLRLEFNSVENTEVRPAAPPPEPVREICGKKAAFATPIWAFAAMRFCSAWTMSGRRARSDEGSPAGTSGGIG